MSFDREISNLFFYYLENMIFDREISDLFFII